MRMNLRLACFSVPFALLVAACGGQTSSGSGGEGGAGAGSSSTASAGGSGGGTGGSGAGAPCQTGGASTLPGVSFEFTTSDCTYTVAEAAAGINIEHAIVAAADVSGVYPTRQGGCDEVGPHGLLPFAKLAGGAQSYCLCDEGLCGGAPPDPYTVPQGTHPLTFEWDGVNWTGPSDFGNPKGEPFPPGDYTLTVSAIGQYAEDPLSGVLKDFSVSGTFLLHLVP
jgi:hypothetical protein